MRHRLGSGLAAGVPANGDSVTIAPTMTQTAPSVTNMPGGLSLQDLSLTNASLSGGAVTVKFAVSYRGSVHVSY